MNKELYESFSNITIEDRNEIIAATFLLDLELGRGTKTEEENVKLFLDYSKSLEIEDEK